MNPDAFAKGRWWEVFGDPALNELEEQAMAQNQSLKAALARVDQARALARVSRSEFFPNIDFDPSYSRQKYSPNQDPSFGNITANSFSMPVDLSYEIDLWGRVRRSFESARAEAQSGVADFFGVLLGVHSEVAQNYFTLRSTDNQRRIVSDTIKLRQEAYDVIKSRARAGTANELDVIRAEAELAIAEGELLGLERNRSQFENALAVLTGGLAPQFGISDTGHYHPEIPLVPAGYPLTCLNGVPTWLPRNGNWRRPTPGYAWPRRRSFPCSG